MRKEEESCEVVRAQRNSHYNLGFASHGPLRPTVIYSEIEK